MGDDQRQPVLRFERVRVSFESAPVLDDISFDVEAGETRVILGAAGSGKTVLLKTALGLVKPDSGKVYLFGRETSGLSEQDLFEVRARVGMLFQESALFDSLTIEENVAYPLVNRRAAVRPPPEEVRERVEESLRFVELEHTLQKFPSELSGGMRRRVGIARAVVTGPPLVLYDSPTAGLDPITANTIIALIVKERDVNNATSLLVTHRFQDGHLLANFRFDQAAGQLRRASENGAGRDLRTMFMVLREGKLVFEGAERELESSADSYVSKFVRH